MQNPVDHIRFISTADCVNYFMMEPLAHTVAFQVFRLEIFHLKKPITIFVCQSFLACTPRIVTSASIPAAFLQRIISIIIVVSYQAEAGFWSMRHVGGEGRGGLPESLVFVRCYQFSTIRNMPSWKGDH